PEHPERVDAAAGAPPRRSDVDLAGPRVHDHILDRNIDRHDLGNEAAGKLGAKPTALPGRMPSAEQQRGRGDLQERGRVLGLCLRAPLADLAVHTTLAVVEAVAKESVTDAMRRIERGAPADAPESCLGEINLHMWDEHATGNGREKTFFQPIGL